MNRRPPRFGARPPRVAFAKRQVFPVAWRGPNRSSPRMHPGGIWLGEPIRRRLSADTTDTQTLDPFFVPNPVASELADFNVIELDASRRGPAAI
jgi:hypothetical protein